MSFGALKVDERFHIRPKRGRAARSARCPIDETGGVAAAPNSAIGNRGSSAPAAGHVRADCPHRVEVIEGDFIEAQHDRLPHQ
jgi:hypothetical protein